MGYVHIFTSNNNNHPINSFNFYNITYKINLCYYTLYIFTSDVTNFTRKLNPSSIDINNRTVKLIFKITRKKSGVFNFISFYLLHCK